MEPADAEIRLLGIEPNDSGKIFGVNKKLLYKNFGKEKNFNYILPFSDSNLFLREPSEGLIARTLIFEAPKSAETTFFAPDIDIKIAGIPNHSIGSVRGNKQIPFINVDDKNIFSTYFHLAKDVTSHFLLERFTYKKTVKYVDVILRYYSGPKGESKFIFEGPFSIDKKIETGSSKKCSLVFLNKIPREHEYFDVFLQLTGSYDQSIPVFAYDKSGKRFIAEEQGNTRIKNGTGFIPVRNVSFTGITLDSIFYITIEERPKEIIYRNVPLYFSE